MTKQSAHKVRHRIHKKKKKLFIRFSLYLVVVGGLVLMHKYLGEQVSSGATIAATVLHLGQFVNEIKE